MLRRSAGLALEPMNDHDKNIVDAATERFERRLAEENGKLRIDMATEFGKVRADMASESGKLRAEMASENGKLRAEMAAGFGALRSEMIDRNAELMKWMLCVFVLQVTAMAGLFALFR